MFSLKAQSGTCLHDVRQGKDSGIETFLIIFHSRKTSQFLTSCCQQYISLCPVQVISCRLHTLHIDSFLFMSAHFPQNSIVKCLCFLTGCPDIHGNLRCIRVRRIQHHLRLLSGKNLLHGSFIQSSCLHSEIFIFHKRFAAVFCRDKSHRLYLMCCQKTADLISFCCSCKNKDFIHSYIPLV